LKTLKNKKIKKLKTKKFRIFGFLIYISDFSIFLNLFFIILIHKNKKIKKKKIKKLTSLLYKNKGIIITKKNKKIENISI
jgi:hypothetical protein